MAFCTKEKQLVDGGSTVVDNRFIINYLPDAADKRSAVYLMGLALSESDGTDNSVEVIAAKLGMTEEEVMDCYAYWEELGLVLVSSNTPPQVVYLSVRGSASALKKIKPSKYAKFSKAIQNVITGRMITVTEYNEYYTFLENHAFEPEALVAVAQYCVDMKGGDIGYRYILTVCRSQLKKGAATLAAVSENLNSQQKYDEDLALVFKALKLSRKADYDDREMYEKWTKDMGFSQEVVCAVAKSCKTGGMGKLDAALCDYYKKKLFDVKEIAEYEKRKAELTELARNVCRAIGVYYQSVDAVVDEYIMDWIRRGYDAETLLAVAKYGFRSGIRTLAGIASVIDKLYKNGVTTVAALEQYLAEMSAKDATVREILEKAGLQRNVAQSDRQLFAAWQKWNLSEELIGLVAERSAGTASPMAYINRVLADCKQKGISTVKQFEAQFAATTATQSKGASAGIPKHEYTDEQLHSLFSALDETEDD